MGDVVHSNQCLLNLNVSPSTVSTLIVSVAENKQTFVAPLEFVSHVIECVFHNVQAFTRAFMYLF